MGLEFLPIFNEWADSYDETVHGHGEEYKEVFENYELILQRVAEKCSGTTLEFGVGTGNLTQVLLNQNIEVYGVEPSPAMRKKVQIKFTNLDILDGDFLNIPTSIKNINTICSTYAFHHLTDSEKEQAIKLYSEILPKGGKILFADTIYETLEAKENIIKKAVHLGYLNLLHDLNTEYYTTMDNLKEIFNKHQFKVEFSQLNSFVWLIDATKL